MRPRINEVRVHSEGATGMARSDDHKRRTRVTRRQALRGMASGLGALTAAAQANAQGSPRSWLDSVFGTNASNASTGSIDEDRKARKAEPLNDLRPNSVPFRSDEMLQSLDGAIQRYQALADKGGWPQIPGNRMIRPEDDDERLPVLRKRLAMGGELRGRRDSSSYSFDGDLETAVRRFQEGHGLRANGRVDKSTLAALNIPVHARIAQLRLNLQRLRDLQAQRVEDRYILVNVPAFQLEAVERQEVQLRHRVIVGKPERQSPEVKATVKAINFFPYWRVPDSVATLDLIPRLRKEPEYLSKEKIRVLTGSFVGPELNPANVDWQTALASQIKFRQDPGPQNALGLMRIDMPNEHGVYMHDTPLKPLFNQRGRAFSAGCVRVQDVFKLGEWIARYEMGWDQPGRAEEVVAAGNALDLTLTRPLPVYFAYITAWAEPDGAVQFRPDLYGRDGLRELTAGRERDETEGPAPTQMLAP